MTTYKFDLKTELALRIPWGEIPYVTLRELLSNFTWMFAKEIGFLTSVELLQFALDKGWLARSSELIFRRTPELMLLNSFEASSTEAKILDLEAYREKRKPQLVVDEDEEPLTQRIPEIELRPTEPMFECWTNEEIIELTDADLTFI